MASIFNKSRAFFQESGITGRRVLLVGGTLVLAGCAYASFKTIPAGHVGYKNLFGEVYDKQYKSGFTFINPLANLVKIDLRKKIAETESLVSSNEGLEIGAKIDIVYRLNQEKARDVYVNAGLAYESILLLPQVKSSIRDTISGYDAKALYNDETRAEIKNKILQYLGKLSENGIIVEDVLINKIALPNALMRSIENKLQAEQEMQKMEFILEKERKEAERKQIEANGIKAFQTIVSEGISQELLQWKGISATEELAKSPNAKIIMIGNNTNGLPLVYNPDTSN